MRAVRRCRSYNKHLSHTGRRRGLRILFQKSLGLFERKIPTQPQKISRLDEFKSNNNLRQDINSLGFGFFMFLRNK